MRINRMTFFRRWEQIQVFCNSLEFENGCNCECMWNVDKNKAINLCVSFFYLYHCIHHDLNFTLFILFFPCFVWILLGLIFIIGFHNIFCFCFCFVCRYQFTLLMANVASFGFIASNSNRWIYARFCFFCVFIIIIEIMVWNVETDIQYIPWTRKG